MWFQPSDNKGAPSGPAFTYLDANGGGDFNSPAGEWFEVHSNNALGASVTHVDVSVGGLDGHQGVLSFDNMHFD
ncbi:MAG: hypothetical protein ABIQ16_27115 [Polyangiaceae bacterium]